MRPVLFLHQASNGNSRFPALIGVLVVVGVVYQLFFRYEHWRGGQDGSQLFERDGLMGTVRRIEAGESVNWLDRILGKGGQISDLKPPVPSAPPSQSSNTLDATPPALKTPTASTTTTAVQANMDLNHDGILEQRIETPVVGEPGNLLDVSIVTTDGRELFYGRGKRLVPLTQQTAGWQDLLLEKPGGSPQQYRYNPTLGAYELAG